MGRRIRSILPQLEKLLLIVPKWEYLKDFQNKNALFKNQQKENYDRHHRVRALTPLPEKSGVWITQGAEPVPGQVTS